MNNKQILIIDDEAPMRYLLEKQLSRAGFDVRTAPDGESGLSMAEATHPDLIVLDMMMPGLDGYAVHQRLHRCPATTAIPVVFLSAAVTAEGRRQAFAVGAADVLSKPLRPNELAQSIAAVFQRAEKPEATTGRFLAFVSLDGPGAASAEAVRLSREIPLQSPGSVLLLDLEFPYGAIAPRLGLAPSPHVLDVFDGSSAATGADVWNTAQSVRGGLRALPARGSASEPLRAEQVLPALDDLVEMGYTVAVNLGPELTALGRAIARRAEVVFAVGAGAAGQWDRLREVMGREGIADERIVRMHAPSTPGLPSATRNGLSPAPAGRHQTSAALPAAVLG